MSFYEPLHLEQTSSKIGVVLLSVKLKSFMYTQSQI